MTQEELAEASGLSTRSISDLERGINLTARRATARLLADAPGLSGTAREQFEALSRGLARMDTGEGGASDGGTGSGAPVPQTLPRDVSSFTGRAPELRSMLKTAAGSPLSGVVAICAIGGMAGVGKTALAVHTAHRLASEFPDGQLFLPLHGHTPGRRAMDPADALADLLQVTGVPAGQIPAGREARASLWRDRLAGKRMLLVLDDAVGSQQVQPLLPSTAGCLVLITSRRHLTALEDATVIELDTPPVGEAVTLLARMVGRPEVDPDDPALEELARLCGRLPLALGMMARQLRHHRAWTPADLAADLAAARDRLAALVAENLSVAAAFDLSYEDLAQGQRLMFRRLGLHPGNDVDGYAAAALAGTDLGTARRYLADLYDHHLLAESAWGRYRLHDLIREHARALAATDPRAETENAINRLLGYYQHTMAIAADRLSRYTMPPSSPHAGWHPPTAAPDLSGSVPALTWMREERGNLLACIDELGHDQGLASGIGRDEWIVALTAGLAPLLRHDGPWPEAIERQVVAAAAARRIGGRRGEAGAVHELGMLRCLTGEYRLSVSALETSLASYRELGDQLGQANCFYGLGATLRRLPDYPAAARMLRDALGSYRDLGDQRGEAVALNDLGIVNYQTGEYADAADALKESLSIYEDIADIQGQASALSGLGATYWRCGRFDSAAEVLESALARYRELGDQPGQAAALIDLGALWLMTADYAQAIDVLKSALDIAATTGDRLAQAGACNFLGFALRHTGDLDGALAALETAVSVYGGVGNRQGEASALHQIGVVRYLLGDEPGAFEAAHAALRAYRKLGNRHGQADSLNDLGHLRRLTGDHPGADRDFTEALALYRELGHPVGEADVLTEFGELYLARGDTGQAAEYLRQALSLSRSRANRHILANALAGLGRCELARGRLAEAEENLRQALDIYHSIGVTDADQVAADLVRLRSERKP